MTDHSVQETADLTGWSPRMLRYLEHTGLVTATRSAGGHRRYTQRQVDRLASLKALIEEHDIAITDLAYERRMRTEPELARAVDTWFGAIHRPTEPASAGLYRRLTSQHRFHQPKEDSR